jgi:hypothetical protein
MDRIDKKIDEKGDWIYNELRAMESRICTTFDNKIHTLEKSMDVKVDKAKDIVDERFKRIDEKDREHERRLDTLDRDSYEYYDKRSKRGAV